MAHSLKGYNLLHGSQFEGIQAIVWLSVWRDTVCHIRKYMGRNEATAHIFRQKRRMMAQAASSFFLFIQSRTLVYGMVPPIFGAHLPYSVKPLWHILTDTPRSMSPPLDQLRSCVTMKTYLHFSEDAFIHTSHGAVLMDESWLGNSAYGDMFKLVRDR